MDNLTRDIVDGIKYAIMDNSYLEANYEETVLLPDVAELYMVNATTIGITCTDGSNYEINITKV